MLGGIALPLDRIPSSLLAHHDLGVRVNHRLGIPEVHFLVREDPCLLPVLIDGRRHVLRWGNRRGDSASLLCDRCGMTWC